MATQDFTALSNQQLKTALGEITKLSHSIDQLFSHCDDAETVIGVVRPLVAHIGLIADRCNEFDAQELDSWVFHTCFHTEGKEASHV
jgi:hypothetical protein